jgi:chorismate mutase-like protein
LNERARFAQQVGISKTASGKAVDFYRPEREAQVLRKALERNRGPLRNEEIARLFREIMSACLAQQEPLKVAFLGPEGTFTQAAVLKHFGSSVRALPLPAIDEVFHEVEGGIADFGVVPIENSSEGTVNHTLDMFLGSALKICGEVELRIQHHLMGRMSALADVKRVCAHAQALAQCRGWLDEHLPEPERIPVSSNAEGARRARDERGTAAIASRAAAEIYGLTMLAEEIEDRSDNTTRFLVVGRKLFSAERRRPHDAAGVGERHRRSRRAVPAARAVRGARHQHDAHRIAALAQAQVGLRVLHRRRGPCERSAARQGAGLARGARLAVQGARLLSAGGAVTAPPAVSAVRRHRQAASRRARRGACRAA